MARDGWSFTAPRNLRIDGVDEEYRDQQDRRSKFTTRTGGP